jgi:hypothetical protein
MAIHGTRERERTMWERARGLRLLILGLGLLGLLIGRFALAEAPNAIACVQDPAAKQQHVTDGG